MEYIVDRNLFDKVMVPNYSPQKIVPVTGKGSRLWDQEGKEYIDFAGGIAVNALGHCHPHLIKTLHEQSQKLWHLSNVYTNEPALALAKQLTDCTFAERVFFCSSGTEANEAAFKLARKYSHDNWTPEKHNIIGFDKSFHGRSLFTVSVGGQVKYREGFAPTPAGITHVPFNDSEALEKEISQNTCAVVIEPIQAEGGIHLANKDFLITARSLCDQYDALLIFDEVQTGMGRTGHLYAYMDTEVTPDILTSAKALGAGFPIGAMLTTEKIAQSFGIGTHGSTYGGNPLACAISLEALKLINDKKLLANIAHKHDLITQGLKKINKEFNIFSEIRGKGLLIGAELTNSWTGRARDFLTAGIKNGVMLLVAGPNVLRFTPSLIIPDNDIKEGLNRLTSAIKGLIKMQKKQ